MSSISVGIIGLPNVGKSTLFNALLKKQQAMAANYPFATIEPNVGVVSVPDGRLTQLAEITKAEEGMSLLPPIKPATVEFVDIAGLVKGASEGAGLGNKFLSHIREVQVIAHVVRAFEDANVIREGSVDPKSDYETIRTELILADLSTLQNQESRILRKGSGQVKNQGEKKIVQDIIQALDKGETFDSSQVSKEELAFFRQLNLLSSKPEIIVLNVSESDYNENSISTTTEQYTSLLNQNKANFVVISAEIESQLASLSDDEQKQYLADLGLKSSGLERLIQKAYEKLGLISFLTCGEKEVRAWTIKSGSDAVLASGAIHTDFMKKFIKAEVVSYNDFVELGGWKNAREKGRARMEGRNYIVENGDVIEFKIGK